MSGQAKREKKNPNHGENRSSDFCVYGIRSAQTGGVVVTGCGRTKIGVVTSCGRYAVLFLTNGGLKCARAL